MAVALVSHGARRCAFLRNIHEEMWSTERTAYDSFTARNRRRLHALALLPLARTPRLGRRSVLSAPHARHRAPRTLHKRAHRNDVARSAPVDRAPSTGPSAVPRPGGPRYSPAKPGVSRCRTSGGGAAVASPCAGVPQMRNRAFAEAVRRPEVGGREPLLSAAALARWRGQEPCAESGSWGLKGLHVHHGQQLRLHQGHRARRPMLEASHVLWQHLLRLRCRGGETSPATSRRRRRRSPRWRGSCGRSHGPPASCASVRGHGGGCCDLIGGVGDVAQGSAHVASDADTMDPTRFLTPSSAQLCAWWSGTPAESRARGARVRASRWHHGLRSVLGGAGVHTMRAHAFRRDLDGGVPRILLSGGHRGVAREAARRFAA